MIKVRITTLAFNFLLGLLLALPSFGAEVYEVDENELDALMEANISFMEKAIADQDAIRGQQRGNPAGGVINAPIPKPIPAREAAPNNPRQEGATDRAHDGIDHPRGQTDRPRDGNGGGGDSLQD